MPIYFGSFSGSNFDSNCRTGSVSEFCALFATVDGSVRLGEASLADLDPFFSDDETDENLNIPVVTTKNVTKSGASGGNKNAINNVVKNLTASQKAATLKAASTWDTAVEYQKECKLAEPYTMPKDKIKDGGGEIHWAQCIADASHCSDLVKNNSNLNRNQLIIPRTRLARGVGSSAVNLSAFAMYTAPLIYILSDILQQCPKYWPLSA